MKGLRSDLVDLVELEVLKLNNDTKGIRKFDTEENLLDAAFVEKDDEFQYKLKDKDGEDTTVSKLLDPSGEHYKKFG